MKKIMVLNTKGGSGKSTVATNLAGYYANQRLKVAIADMDPQKSSLEWLRARSARFARIYGIAAANEPISNTPELDLLIIDTPAGLQGEKIAENMRDADAILIPVLPSPMDIRAAAKFIHELLIVHKVSREKTKVGIVANRIRKNTLAYKSLERFINALNIPFVSSLRETRNYILAADGGISLFDLPEKQIERDLEQWQAIVEWLDLNFDEAEKGLAEGGF